MNNNMIKFLLNLFITSISGVNKIYYSWGKGYKFPSIKIYVGKPVNPFNIYIDTTILSFYCFLKKNTYLICIIL